MSERDERLAESEAQVPMSHNAGISDIGPASMSLKCNLGGPREAMSDCVRAPDHGGDHCDRAGGEWPVAERPRFSPGQPQRDPS